MNVDSLSVRNWQKVEKGVREMWFHQELVPVVDFIQASLAQLSLNFRTLAAEPTEPHCPNNSHSCGDYTFSRRKAASEPL